MASATLTEFRLVELWFEEVVNTWADIINRANLGMEVMHERNAHNFPLDLASVEAPSVNG